MISNMNLKTIHLKLLSNLPGEMSQYYWYGKLSHRQQMWGPDLQTIDLLLAEFILQDTGTVSARYIAVGGVQAMVPRYKWERDIYLVCNCIWHHSTTWKGHRFFRSILNPLRAKFFRGNKNIYLHFMSFPHIGLTHVVEISSWKTRHCPVYLVNIMAADGLGTEGARSSAITILT